MKIHNEDEMMWFEIAKRFRNDTLFDESWNRCWSDSRIVLLVQEPTVVHAYWEVDKLKRHLVSKHFLSDWVNLPFCLQLYDVTDIHFNGYNAHRTQRIQVQPDSDNWYVHGVEPFRQYVMDFGTTTLLGDFFTILRSNVVQTPPDRPYRPVAGPLEFAKLAHMPITFNATRTCEETARLGKTNEIERPTNAQQPYPNGFDGYSIRVDREG